MYHTQKINQAQIDKNLKTTGLLSKNLQTSHYTNDIDAYLRGLTPKKRMVLKVYLRYDRYSSIKLTNERVAKEANCSIVTVIRSTNQFHKDGFLIKHQENRYAPNNFSFSHRYRNACVSNKAGIGNKKEVIFSLRNDRQNKSLILDIYLSRKRYPFLVRARAREGLVFEKTKGTKVKPILKQWILNNRFDPTVKDVIMDPQIKSNFITDTIEKITKLLTLDESEQFRLIPFPEEVLQYVLGCIEPIVSGKKVLKAPVYDKIGWLMSIANSHCTKSNIKPDWSWYYDLCGIVGIDTRYNSEKKPLVVAKPKVKKQGIYARWEAPKERSTESRAEYLREEIKSYEMKLANPQKYYAFCLKESVKRAENKLVECLEELIALERSSDEKQIVLYQSQSNIMATCSA